MAFAVPLSGAAVDTLHCLFRHGPTMDGDVPSKSGRDELVMFGLAVHYQGFAWLNKAGVKLALENGVDAAKERWQREQRERRAASPLVIATIDE